MEKQVKLYKSPDKKVELKVNFDKETVWLSQVQIAALFQRERTVITKHIKNVFKEGELDEKLVMCKFCTHHPAWCNER